MALLDQGDSIDSVLDMLRRFEARLRRLTRPRVSKHRAHWPGPAPLRAVVLVGDLVVKERVCHRTCPDCANTAQTGQDLRRTRAYFDHPLTPSRGKAAHLIGRLPATNLVNTTRSL